MSASTKFCTERRSSSSSSVTAPRLSPRASSIGERNGRRGASSIEQVVAAHVERLGQSDDGVGRGGDVAVLIAADLAGVRTDLGGEVPLGPPLFAAQCLDPFPDGHGHLSLVAACPFCGVFVTYVGDSCR